MKRINWYIVNGLVLLPVLGYIFVSLTQAKVVVFYIGIVTGIFLCLGFQNIYYRK